MGFVYDSDPSHLAGGGHRQVEAGAGADGAGAVGGVVVGEVYACFQPAAAALVAAAAENEAEEVEEVVEVEREEEARGRQTHALKDKTQRSGSTSLIPPPPPLYTSSEAECVVCLNAGELCVQIASHEALWFTLGWGVA